MVIIVQGVKLGINRKVDALNDSISNLISITNSLLLNSNLNLIFYCLALRIKYLYLNIVGTL